MVYPVHDSGFTKTGEVNRAVVDEAARQLKNAGASVRELDAKKLRRAFTYFKVETLTRRDFYLLWISRFFYLICAASALSHWKAYSYTRNADDKVE